MRKRRKKRHSQEEVQLNLAAMLDMAFQLLTFFILTFKPAPVEGDVMLRMPPAVPTTAVANAPATASNENNKDPVKGLNSLVITAVGSPTGTIQLMAVGDTPVVGLGGLEGKLKSVFGDEGAGFDQVILQVGPTLHYDQLMQIVDICTRQKLPNGEKLSKLSIEELAAPSGG